MLSPHPLAELFPPMDDVTFAALVSDIRQNGLREPIIIHEGQILDGRNRYRACTEIGIEPITRPWDGRGDPLDYVVSKNLHRRHLDEAQRAGVAAKIANMRLGDNQHQKEGRPIGRPSDAPPISQVQAAKMLNVSPRSVGRAAAVQSTGVPDLQKAVWEGAVSLAAAEEIARKPQEEQHEIMSRGLEAVQQAAKASREARPKKPADKKDANAKRSETQKLKAELYRQLRDAVELLCGLPDPAEVVSIVAGSHNMRATIDARLPQALTWIQRFHNDYSNRRQDSSAA